jgi:DNA ligase-1
MSKLRPMKADNVVLDKLTYPLYVSPKLDGIRAVIVDGVVMSNSMKPIRNEYVQECFGREELNCLDGELIVGKPWAEDVYLKTNSGVMSKEGKPDVMFYVFDNIFREDDWIDWFVRVDQNRYFENLFHNVRLVNQYHVFTQKGLKEHEAAFVASGYEGAMVRKPNSPYKHGRSTVNQGYLLKLKSFLDSEAVIEGYEELLHNNNEKKTNELGYAQRASHAENKTPGGVLGALHVRDVKTGVDFHIGTGFDAATRKQLWDNRELLIGKIVKYKYFPVGVKEKPRHPSFLGFRDPDDM